MKILIVRTIQFDLMVKLIKDIRTRYPGSAISILTNPQQYDSVKGLRKVDKVFVTRLFRDFSLTNIGFKNIVKIWKSAFDMVIIPHKQRGLEGFGNVLLMLPFLGISKWLHCSTDWNLREVNKLSPFFLILKSLLSTLFFIPLAFISLLGFIYIFWREKKSLKTSNSNRWYAGFGDI